MVNKFAKFQHKYNLDPRIKVKSFITISSRKVQKIFFKPTKYKPFFYNHHEISRFIHCHHF